MSNILFYYRCPMESNGRLDVRINKRRTIQRNSFAPSQSQPSNEFANSHYSQTDQDLSQNNSIRPIQPPPQPPKQREPSRDLKQSINIDIPNKNPQRHNHNLDVIQEQKKEQIKIKPQKRRNNFNSFEPTKLEPSPQISPPAKIDNPIKKSQIESPQRQKQVSIEERKVNDINKNIEKLNQSINDLRQNYEDLTNKQREMTDRRSKKKERDLSPFGVKMSQQKEKEIKEFLSLKQQEERARRKKLEDFNQKEQHKLTLEQREQEMLKERQKKRRLKELKAYSKFDEKHQKWMQTQQEKQQLAQELMRKHEGEVKFHIKMELEDKEKLKMKLKKEKQILQQRKDYFKSVDITEIEQHQKWYEDKLYELTREKQDAKEEEAQRIAEENSNSNELWRGQSHGFVEDQIIQKKKKKREPREKARRIREYKNYVKKNFIPKTYHSQTVEPRQINNDSRLSHREVKRYRYYKGSAYGEVVQNLPKSKNHKQQNRLGDNYLEFMKSLPKKREQTPEEELRLDPEEIEILERKFNSIGKVKRSVHPIYDENYRKKTTIEIPKNVKRDELKMIVLQLQANDQKLKQKQILLNYQQHGKVENVQGEQKSINQGLVQNIQRKLSLLAQI